MGDDDMATILTALQQIYTGKQRAVTGLKYQLDADISWLFSVHDTKPAIPLIYALFEA
jgi:hypothetical protein